MFRFVCIFIFTVSVTAQPPDRTTTTITESEMWHGWTLDVPLPNGTIGPLTFSDPLGVARIVTAGPNNGNTTLSLVFPPRPGYSVDDMSCVGTIRSASGNYLHTIIITRDVLPWGARPAYFTFLIINVVLGAVWVAPLDIVGEAFPLVVLGPRYLHAMTFSTAVTTSPSLNDLLCDWSIVAIAFLLASAVLRRPSVAHAQYALGVMFLPLAVHSFTLLSTHDSVVHVTLGAVSLLVMSIIVLRIARYLRRHYTGMYATKRSRDVFFGFQGEWVKGSTFTCADTFLMNVTSRRMYWALVPCGMAGSVAFLGSRVIPVVMYARVMMGCVCAVYGVMFLTLQPLRSPLLNALSAASMITYSIVPVAGGWAGAAGVWIAVLRTVVFYALHVRERMASSLPRVAVLPSPPPSSSLEQRLIIVEADSVPPIIVSSSPGRRWVLLEDDEVMQEREPPTSWSPPPHIPYTTDGVQPACVMSSSESLESLPEEEEEDAAGDICFAPSPRLHHNVTKETIDVDDDESSLDSDHCHPYPQNNKASVSYPAGLEMVTDFTDPRVVKTRHMLPNLEDNDTTSHVISPSKSANVARFVESCDVFLSASNMDSQFPASEAQIASDAAERKRLRLQMKRLKK